MTTTTPQSRRKKPISPKLTPKQRPLKTCLERDLPLGWQALAFPPGYNIVDGGRAFESPNELQVIESIGVEQDGKRWQHISVLRHGQRTPSWDDLVMVKRLFCGHQTTVLQVIPPSQKHVSINDNVLHLFRCLDGEVTPDFTRGLPQI